MTPVQIDVRENVPLAPLTTLGVGGPARFLVTSHSVAEVEQAVMLAGEKRADLLVLGGGSNLVISDQGFDGLVLQIAIDGIDDSHQPGNMALRVGAGVNWDELVAMCVARGYGGIECLSGIPGSVGGTPVQNVGAYGQEVSETIASVLTYDLSERRVRELRKEECGFSYRSSIFNTSQRGRHIILRVTYELQSGASPTLRYADLQKHFAGTKNNPTLASVREAVLKIRASKGMVIDPSDPDSRSVGSFFKNPVLSAEQFTQLEQKASSRGLKIPSYPALPQHSKVSAAWLVENSGFQKGYSKGPVGISSKHALAIMNRGGATAADVLSLCNEIQSKVEQTWSVRLQPEPVFVGF